MNFFFGVRDHLKNHGNVSKWVSAYQGEVQFIDGFNIASEEAQWKIYRFCQKLGNFSRTYSDPVTGRAGQAQCFITDFKQWVEATGLEFPVPAKLFDITFARWLL